MKGKLLLLISIALCGVYSQAQINFENELEQFNIYVLPQPEINVKLSFNSRYMRNDPRAFSVTRDREAIDMMGIYRDSQELEHKEYTPHIVAHFERKRELQRQQQDALAVPASITIQNPYYSNSNLAWQQLRRRSYFSQLYTPIYRY
ncbi:MAG: hypothetical protein ACSHWW_12210 [Nonlabens sp.]|uniref:hypothetical protein n=1 Tax=Nonlabens sp. TaxID=1888209 RepID=UPI003EF38937